MIDPDMRVEFQNSLQEQFDALLKVEGILVSIVSKKQISCGVEEECAIQLCKLFLAQLAMMTYLNHHAEERKIGHG